MEPVTLTIGDLQVLSDLDSKQFGFLILTEEGNAKKKAIVLKAINYLERVIVRTREKARAKANQDENNQRNNTNANTLADVDAKIYCKLGHLHLLLEDHSKALSAYQKYMRMTKEKRRRSSEDKLDPCLLYGLGLVYFHYNAFLLADRAFHDLLYLYPAFERSNEVHLRLGIMAKISGDYDISLKYLNTALSDVSSACSFTRHEIKFHVAHVYEVRGDSHAKAKDLYEELLKETDISANLKADVYRQLGWMFHSVEALGERTTRLHTAIQFLEESKKCSTKKNHGQTMYLLGRCYAGLGKVHDAFVNYRNSVDKSESNADTWCSIGVLYQQQAQPMDALQAYICAVQLDKNHSAAWTNLGLLYESTRQPQDALACYNNAKGANSPHLHQRIKYLKAQLSNLPPAPPPPMQTGPGMKPKQLPSVEEAWNVPISNEMTSRHPAPSTTAGGAAGAQKPKTQIQPQQMIRPPFYLNQQQLQTLQYLQQLNPLNPQQQQLLHQLQHQFRMMQQHQHQQRQQQAQQQMQQQQQQQQNDEASLLSELANKDIGDVSDQDLQSLLSEQDLGSFAESLLKQIQGDMGDIDMGAMADQKPEGAGETPPHSSEDEAITKVRTLDIPTKLETVRSNVPVKLQINIGMKGSEVIDACAKFANKNISISKVIDTVHSLPHVPERPKDKLSKEQLLPPTPSVYLDNKKDAFSPQLQEFCQEHPITVVRGIANALKMDCGLFSTKALLETNPSQNIEIKNQLRPDSITMDSKQSWKCVSTSAYTTLGKFCRYQMAQFQENLKEEQDKTTNSGAAAAAFRHEARRKACPFLKFTDNVDLSDSRKWKGQMSELTKLPSWARVVSAGNMLSHLGYPIQGMNTVKLNMEVPNSRSPAEQESFCIININIGPGDCEWFGVPFEYWGALKALCDKHGVNYLHSQWWPIMQDLMDDEIPVYRFLQRPGDLVWVNSGCVHWTQAQGWCNSITWKVAPLTHKQYSLALERYEWDKLQNFKSVVGMTHLSWNLARNVRVSDQKLFETLKKTLLQSLKQVILTQEYIKSLDDEMLEPKFHGHPTREPPNFCGHCDKEVFGIFFIRASDPDGQGLIHCLNCAHRRSHSLKGFICLEEYKLKELSDVYDAFKIHQQQQTPTASPGINPAMGQMGATTATGMANPAAVGGQVAVSTATSMASMASAASMASMTNSTAATQQALMAMAAQQAAAASAFTGGASAAGINAELLAAMGQYQQYQKTIQQQQQQQLNQQTFGKMDMS